MQRRGSKQCCSLKILFLQTHFFGGMRENILLGEVLDNDVL